MRAENVHSLALQYKLWSAYKYIPDMTLSTLSQPTLYEQLTKMLLIYLNSIDFYKVKDD